MNNFFTKILGLLLFLFLTVDGYSQFRCGFRPQEEDVNRLLTNKRLVEENKDRAQSRNLRFIPLKFHVVGDDDGNGQVNENNLLATVCQLNEDFAPHDIQFFITDDGFNYIESSILHRNPTSHASVVTINQNMDLGAVNAFITDEILFDADALGTTLGIYLNQTADVVVAIRSRIDGQDKTLPHELGHYFGLLHTFNGWDSEGYNVSSHGNPVSTSSPDGVPTEQMDRIGVCKNCETAGDFICDTRPDYNFGISGFSCNNFSASFRDPCGEVVVPDAGNYMSYFFNCTNESFSEQQAEIMNADIDRRLRNRDIDPSRQPITTGTVSAAPSLVSPIAGEATQFYNTVELNWNAVANASHYLVEVDILPNFVSQKPIKKILFVKGNQAIVKGLDPDRLYYWRVRALNQYLTCLSFETLSDRSSFFTSSDFDTSNESTNLFEEFNLYPNPTLSGGQLSASIKPLTGTKQLNIEIWSLEGKLIYQKEQKITSNNQNISIPIPNDTDAGVYFVSFSNKETGERFVEKVLVQ